MRILYLAPDPVPYPKGAATRIQATVAALRALDHEVTLFTPKARACTATNHDSVPLDGDNFLERMLAFRRAATSWLDAHDADLVHFRSVWEGLPALAWARRRSARSIWEAHGLPSVELPYHYPGVARAPRLIEKIIDEERRILSGTDVLIVPSRTSARFFRRMGFPAERVHVIPNSVDIERFIPAPVPPPDAPPFRLVYVGTLAPWQGIETLLEALALLRNRTLIELHVIGPAKSAWRTALRRTALRLRVHNLLHFSEPMDQSDLLPVLHTAHVCVAPLLADSRNVLQGCCPIKLLEYMAAGRPILATRIAAVEEILEHGATAHLVRPGSAVTLADGLLWMLDHGPERERLGLQARMIAESAWNSAIFQERLDRALKRLFRGTAP